MSSADVAIWLAVGALLGAVLAGVAHAMARGGRRLLAVALVIAAGWALHPLWDVAVHHAGPGAGIAPAWYAVACIGFDLVVAAYVAARILHPSGGRWQAAGNG